MPVWEYFKNRGLSPHHRATGPFCKILFTDKSLEEGSVKGGTCRPPIWRQGGLSPPPPHTRRRAAAVCNLLLALGNEHLVRL